MPRKVDHVPSFASEADERAWWETYDSADHVDWSQAKRARFPNLKPSTTAILLRLPKAGQPLVTGDAP